MLFAWSCSPLRTPVPPGSIPEQEYVTNEDEQYGHAVLNSLVERYPLDTSDARINRCRTIVDKLTKPLNDKNSIWHLYVLVDDAFKNAAATRGNYIFIWTGMLKSVKNDEELATILAHEIGHLLAGHPKPTPLEEVNSMLANVAGATTREVLYQQGGAVGALSQLAEVLVQESVKAFIINPEERRKELEADHIGLFLMADAGYDPSKAVTFWERVQTDPDFADFPLEFMSDHPTSSDRLAELKIHLPKAMQKYQFTRGFDEEKDSFVIDE